MRSVNILHPRMFPQGKELFSDQRSGIMLQICIMKRWCFTVITGAAICFYSLSGLTNPRTLTVRSKSRLNISFETDTPGAHSTTFELKGELRDERGGPIPRAIIQLGLLGGRQSLVTTDNRGGFRKKLRFSGRQRTLEARFPGDPYHSATVMHYDLNPRLLPVQLRLEGPREFLRSDREVVYKAMARAGGKPLKGVPLKLSWKFENQEKGTTVQLTDPQGVAFFRHGAAELGFVGPALLTLHISQSPITNAHHWSIDVNLSAPVRITMAARSQELSKGDTLLFSGIVQDDRIPLSRAWLSLYLDGRALTVIRTGEDGRFSHPVKTDGLKPGRHIFQAAFIPHVAWRTAAASEAVAVMLTPSASFLDWMSRILILGLVLLMLFPLLKLISCSWFRRGAANGGETAQTKGLLSRVIRRLRRPSYVVKGKILDAVTGAPLANARVEDEDASIGVSTSRDGQFQLGPLPDGYRIMVFTRKGYAPERRLLQIPHQGENSALAIPLSTWREKIFLSYQGIVARISDNKDLTGLLTPREITGLLPLKSPELSDTFRKLTANLEEFYFSGRTPGQEAAERFTNDIEYFHNRNATR